MSEEIFDAVGVLSGKRRVFGMLLENARRLKEGWFGPIFGPAATPKVENPREVGQNLPKKNFPIETGDSVVTENLVEVDFDQNSSHEAHLADWIGKERISMLFEKGENAGGPLEKVDPPVCSDEGEDTPPVPLPGLRAFFASHRAGAEAPIVQVAMITAEAVEDEEGGGAQQAHNKPTSRRRKRSSVRSLSRR